LARQRIKIKINFSLLQPAPKVPKEKVVVSFSRSSGPGGQNVNKRSTKAEIRFNVDSADWIPDPMKPILKTKYATYLNKDNELIVSADKHRTQEENTKNCFNKLQAYINEAHANMHGLPGKKEIKIERIIKRKKKQHKRAKTKLELLKMEEETGTQTNTNSTVPPSSPTTVPKPKPDTTQD
jgi:peptidyl-tRNA hydrolase ICT1